MSVFRIAIIWLVCCLCFSSCDRSISDEFTNSLKSKGSQKNQRTNVLFIVADDLNCDLSVYGHPHVKSPNIARLAAEGVLFENAHCQYPLCGPSRASFMTGMYCDQTKVEDNNVFLRSAIPDVITLGQRFRQQGYRSVRIGKIFHYDNPSAIGTSGADDGYTWDQTINPYGRDKFEEYKINTLLPRRYGGTLSWMASGGEDSEQTDGIGALEAVDMINEFAETGDNFFLALGFFRPHTPFVAPEKYFDLYTADDLDVPESSDEYLRSLPEPARRSIRAKASQLDLAIPLAQEIQRAYYATISFVDAQVGVVLDALEASGLRENTLVVLVSDHGYHMGEHGHWQKQTLFNNATRVPLIIAPPGGESLSKRTDTPVELVDLYPTIMDFVGIETPDHVVGRSLVPIVRSKEINVRESALTKWRKGYSVCTKNYRITRWGKYGELGVELYDRRHDPNELENLASNPHYSGVLDSLRVVLESRVEECKRLPIGIGRQFSGVGPHNKAPNITPGDYFDTNGNQYFFRSDSALVPPSEIFDEYQE